MTPEQLTELEDLLTDAGPGAVLVYVDARSIRQLIDEVKRTQRVEVELKDTTSIVEYLEQQRDSIIAGSNAVIIHLEAERDRLAVALRKFGCHDRWCISINADVKCDCGFAAALAGIEKKP